MLICYVILIAVFWVAIKAFSIKEQHEDDPEPENEGRSYSEIREEIISLNELKDNIDLINDMIADVHSCAPGKVHKTITIKILESDRKVSFIVTGEDEESKMIVQLLEKERENYSSSLRKTIRKIK